MLAEITFIRDSRHFHTLYCRHLRFDATLYAAIFF